MYSSMGHSSVCYLLYNKCYLLYSKWYLLMHFQKKKSQTSIHYPPRYFSVCISNQSLIFTSSSYFDFEVQLSYKEMRKSQRHHSARFNKGTKMGNPNLHQDTDVAHHPRKLIRVPSLQTSPPLSHRQLLLFWVFPTIPQFCLLKNSVLNGTKGMCHLLCFFFY